MKIAFVTPYWDPAVCGIKQVVKELATRLAKDNEVHIYCSDWDKQKRIKIKYEFKDGLHIHRCCNLIKFGNFGTFWPSVFFKLISNNYDIIHSHGTGHPHVLLAALAAKLKNVKHIHTTHCPWTDNFRPLLTRLMLPIAYNIFTRLSYKLTSKIIAITPWELDFIKKYSKKKIEVIPNGVSKIFYKKTKSLKKELKLKNKVVLYFGRFNITKGVDKLALAAKDILKTRDDITFLFVGPDEGIKTKVKEILKHEKNAKILEPILDREKIVQLYNSANVFVLPSYREGLPLTLIESMAAGLPIVASPVNGIPYEMENNVNGIFVKYGDLKGLKDNIIKIIDDKKLARKFSINNKKKAKNYDWDLIYKRYMKVYSEP